MKAWKHALACGAIMSAILAGAPAVRAGGEMQNALKAIPGDVIGFLSVPSASALDEKVMKVAQTLGLAPMMPGSPLQLFKDYLLRGASEGLDGNGAMSVYMFEPKGTGDAAFDAATVLQLPAADPQTLMQELGCEAEVDGLRPLELFGEAQYAVARGKYVCIGSNKDLLKKLQSTEGDITGRIGASALENLSTLDIALWIDVQKAGKLAKPMINQFLEMMDTGGGPASIEAIQHKSMVKNVNMLMEGLDAFQMGLGVTPKGIMTSFHLTAKSGTKLGDTFKDAKYTDSSLLAGLPADPYILAAGQTVDSKAMQESWDDLNAILSSDDLKQACDAESLSTIRTQLESLLTTLKGGAVSVSLLPESPEGLIGVAAAIHVADSAKWLDALESSVNAAKTVSNDEEAKKALEKLTFHKGASTVDGASVSTITFDLPAAADMDPDDTDKMKKVLGKDGVLFYVAPADADTVVVTFGGGEAHLAEVLKTAKSGAAPLREDAGISKVSSVLPKKRNSEVYFAGDRLFKLIENISKAAGEGPLPIRMAEVNAPIALVTTGGDLHVQMDLFLPMEMVVAIKDTVMQAMFSSGMMQQQGGAEDESL